MKHLTIIAALAASAAHATYYPPTTPDPATNMTGKQDQTQQQQQGQGQAQQAISGAASASTSHGGTHTLTSTNSAAGGDSSASGGHSASSAQGGAGGRASSDSYNANNIGMDSSDNSKFLSLSLPQPVWVKLPQATHCMGSHSDAWAVGWNFISRAQAGQGMDPICTGMELAARAYQHCHFESEYLITNRVYRGIFPDAEDLPRPDGLKNYSLSECEQMRNPRLRVEPVLTIPQQSLAPAQQTCEIHVTEAARPASPQARKKAVVAPKKEVCQ